METNPADQQLSPNRCIDFDHHLRQAHVWLSMSSSNKNSSFLSYAAFELRLAIERLVLEWWMKILKGRRTKEHVHDIRSFNKMKNRIFHFVGNQNKINRHFRSVQIALKILQIKLHIVPPDFSKFESAYNDCSDLCHIGWTVDMGFGALDTNQKETHLLREKAQTRLTEIHHMLSDHASSLMSWPGLGEGASGEIMTDYVEGRLDDQALEKKLRDVGLYAQVCYPDGRPSEFLGQSIAPE